MPGLPQAPYRAPCGGWKPVKAYMGGCFQNKVASATTVDKWLQQTTCNDHYGANPKPYYPSIDTGVGWPSTLVGGGIPCPGTTPGTNVGCEPANSYPSSDPATGPHCGAWWDTILAHYPDDYVVCSAPGPNHATIGFNCYTKSGTTDLSVCRKLGFKNVQAIKQWHGRYHYWSHMEGMSTVDYSNYLPDQTCDGHTQTITGVYCNSKDVEADQTSHPDLGKFLHEYADCYFDLTLTGGGTSHTGGYCKRECTVDRYTGLFTHNNGSAEGDYYSLPAAHDILYGYANYRNAQATDRPAGPVPGSTFPFAHFGSTINKDVAVSWFEHCLDYVQSFNTGIRDMTYAWVVTGGGSQNRYVTCTAADNWLTGTAGDTVFTAELHTGSGTFIYRAYGWDRTSTNWVINLWEEFTFGGNTSASHHYKGVHYSGAITYTTEWTVNMSIDTTYDAAQLRDDMAYLMSFWDLTDDLNYPWRIDEYCSIAPLVTRRERAANAPNCAPEGAVNPDGSFQTAVDGDAQFYDGAVIGKPTGLPGQDRGHFDFTHVTHKQCCGDSLTGQHINTYDYAYGAYSGEDVTGVDPTDAKMPRTATQWTACVGQNSGSVDLPIALCGDGVGNPPNETPQTTFVPGDMPNGAWLFYAQNRIYGQKWAEIRIKRPSYDYARPCGPDRYAVQDWDQWDPSKPTTVRCIQPGGTVGGFNVDVAWGGSSSSGVISNGDLVFVAGCPTIADGLYQVTVTGLTSGTLAAKPFAPNYTYPGAVGGNGVLGRLRWQSGGNVAQPGICGQVEVVDVQPTTYSGTPMTQVKLGHAAYLHDGDVVDIAYCGGATYINGSSWSIVKVVDATHFIVNVTGAAVYTGGGYVVSHGATSYQWHDDQSKGDYVHAEWRFNYRDIGERDRMNAQYDNVGTCSEVGWTAHQPVIRQNQYTYNGMDRAVSAINLTASCLPMTACSPAVLCISPNGETFVGGATYGFISGSDFAADGRYTSRWQAAFIQHDVDYLWQAPRKPCVTVGGVSGQTACSYLEDTGGGCWTGDCPDPAAGIPSESLIYPHPPMVEARITSPGPALPGACYQAYLTLADMDVTHYVVGKHLLPPLGAGYPDAGTTASCAPNTHDTPWGLLLREANCICSHGAYETQYADNGSTMACPVTIP